MTESAERILSNIISAQIGTYTALYAPDTAVITISNLIRLNEGMTRYRARKALKELIDEGLIYYTSQGCPAIESCGEYRELVYEAMPPINGYALTEQGFKSKQYRAAYKDWERSMAEWAAVASR